MTTVDTDPVKYCCPFCGKFFDPERKALSRYERCWICSECGRHEAAVGKLSSSTEHAFRTYKKLDIMAHEIVNLKYQLECALKNQTHWYKRWLKVAHNEKTVTDLQTTCRQLLLRLETVSRERNKFIALSLGLSPQKTADKRWEIDRTTLVRSSRKMYEVTRVNL